VHIIPPCCIICKVRTNIDYHCHYTGSLSLRYIHHCFKKRDIDWESNKDCFAFAFKTKDDFENVKNQDKEVFYNRILNKFSNTNWKKNYNTFFKIYGLLQQITKSPSLVEQTLLYETGGFDICKQYILEKVNQFQLRVGPRLSYNETVLRINSLVKRPLNN